MTTNLRSDPSDRAKKSISWPVIVLEALAPTRGEIVPLAAIYTAVEAHPEARRRAATNHFIRPKVRQALQALRDDGKVEWLGPGRWRLPVTS